MVRSLQRCCHCRKEGRTEERTSKRRETDPGRQREAEGGRGRRPREKVQGVAASACPAPCKGRGVCCKCSAPLQLSPSPPLSVRAQRVLHCAMLRLQVLAWHGASSPPSGPAAPPFSWPLFFSSCSSSFPSPPALPLPKCVFSPPSLLLF